MRFGGDVIEEIINELFKEENKMTGQQIIDALTPYKDKEIELITYGTNVEFWINEGETQILELEMIK